VSESQMISSASATSVVNHAIRIPTVKTMDVIYCLFNVPNVLQNIMDVALSPALK